MIKQHCLTGATAAATLLILAATPGQAANAPMRPALIGSGPRSLINLIDTNGLMKHGQGHAALFFFCSIEPDGVARRFRVFGTDASSKLLRDEVRAKINEAHFIPAVYNGHETYAELHGTITFSVINGKPHLRIFCNQEVPELQKESDFISPQPIFIPNHQYDFTGIKYPGKGFWSDDQPAAVELNLNVDAQGDVKDLHPIKATPPDPKFSEVAMRILKQVTWLPAYRNGQPVESTTHYRFYFVPYGWSLW